jgi:hypothetical protein
MISLLVQIVSIYGRAGQFVVSFPAKKSKPLAAKPMHRLLIADQSLCKNLSSLSWGSRKVQLRIGVPSLQARDTIQLWLVIEWSIRSQSSRASAIV